MAKKTITINERTFELVNRQGVYRDLYPHRSIWDCYNRPSRTKEEIYEDWLKWAVDTDVESFGVCSYNCNFFTLTGLFYNNDDECYFLKITPCHNYATRIS